MAKSPPTNVPKQEKEEGNVAEVPAKKPSSKRRLLILVGMLLLSIGGGSAWFMLGDKHSGSGQAQAKPVKPVAPERPPLFLALEAFTVNLQPQASDQYLQTEITLRVAGQEVVDQIKLHMPEVRNRVLMLLSTKAAQELTSTAGKQKLADDIRTEITRVVDPDAIEPEPQVKLTKQPLDAAQAADDNAIAAEPADEEPAPEDYKVRSVLFTSFIIQ